MRPSYDLSAHDDIGALVLLVETADAYALPETYEVKVTVAFMRGLLGCIEDLQAVTQDDEAAQATARVGAGQRSLTCENGRMRWRRR